MQYSVKKNKQELSQKRLEGYLKLSKIVQWGRKNPIYFVRDFYGIEFLDYQSYVFMKSWTTPNVVWCFSRNGSKTTMGGIFIMAKSNLIPNFRTYILSGSGQQSQELFLKIEDIAKKNIATFTGLTDVFMNETVKSVANSTGFTHNPQSFGFDLYNGSKVRTLNSDFDNNRGKRSNLNYYDESGFCDDNLFLTSEPFLAQNSNFRLGGATSADLLPKQAPNQKIYASSASSVDTYFFKKYKEYAKRMFMGDKNFFVADINCDAIISATFHGKLYSTPLLERREVDDALVQNKEKALREYYNKFTVEGGDDQLVKRATVIKNSEVYAPVFYNDSKKRRFLLCYDPAHDFDNSIVLICEILKDENIGYYLKVVNLVGFKDLSSKKKKQLRTPEQIEYVRKLVCDYNGKENAEYEGLDNLMIDTGAGGGGNLLPDFFMEDWKDGSGKPHKGFIDKEYSSEHVNKFPNAADKLLAVVPKKHRNEMFAALGEMAKLDLIKFPKDYDMKGCLYLTEDKYEEGTEKISEDDDEELKKGERIITKYNLSLDEEVALKQIDLMKEEVVHIYRYKTGSGYRYDLPPDMVSKKAHDDRAFCMAMAAWRLQQLRLGEITNKPKKQVDYSTIPFFVSTGTL